ncbi:ABC transporter permease [Spirochaetota bacterium]
MLFFNNTKGYFFITKIRILASLSYNFEVWSSIIKNFLILIAVVFIWKSAYNGIPSVGNVTQSQMITYTIVSTLLFTLFNFNIETKIVRGIHSGEIIMDFIKPINPFKGWFFDDLGFSLGHFIMQFFPILLFSILFIQLPLPASSLHFLLFLLSALCSLLIGWLLSALAGMVAFWYLETGYLCVLKNSIIRILSGSFVPIWLFPAWYRNISVYLPFQYMYQTPLSIYIGKLSYKSAVMNIGVQFVWVTIFIIVASLTWQRAKRKLLIQGG